MNKEIVETIQKRVLQLLPTNQRNRRGALLADSCSEVSRLVASWIKEMDGSAQTIILKGDNVCDTEKSHDVLFVESTDGNFYLIDPSVWQFFPEEESILIGVVDSLEEAVKLAEEKYDGNWSVSEKLGVATDDEKETWLKIIQKNIETA